MLQSFILTLFHTVTVALKIIGEAKQRFAHIYSNRKQDVRFLTALMNLKIGCVGV